MKTIISRIYIIKNARGTLKIEELNDLMINDLKIMDELKHGRIL